MNDRSEIRWGVIGCEFAHLSRALLDGTPFRPAPDEALTDALLLDALATPSAVTVVPTAARFLEARS